MVTAYKLDHVIYVNSRYIFFQADTSSQYSTRFVTDGQLSNLHKLKIEKSRSKNAYLGEAVAKQRKQARIALDPSDFRGQSLKLNKFSALYSDFYRKSKLENAIANQQARVRNRSMYLLPLNLAFSLRCARFYSYSSIWQQHPRVECH